ncbi:MAG: hypothetical protein KA352_09245 [Flavobacteriales bacterium]|nr:hypothetical protein [Flavobacteriales bacterium]
MALIRLPWTWAIFAIASLTLYVLSRFWIGSHEDLVNMRQANFPALFLQRWGSGILLVLVFLALHAVHLLRLVKKPTIEMVSTATRVRLIYMIAVLYATIHAVFTLGFILD